MIVKEVYIRAPEDPEAGLPGADAQITSPDDFVLDFDVLAKEDRVLALESFRQKMSEAFSEAWGEDVKVSFLVNDDGSITSGNDRYA